MKKWYGISNKTDNKKYLNRWEVIWQLLKNPKYWVYADGRTVEEFNKNKKKVGL